MRTIRKMLEHSQWANRHLLEHLIANQTVNKKVKQLMAHIVASELVWMTRLQERDSNHIDLWSEIELKECLKQAESNAAIYSEYLAKLHEVDLIKMIHYRNQTGKQYETSIGDILTHVALHSQYHRGQINSLMRYDGKDPVNVDMITYIREISQN